MVRGPYTTREMYGRWGPGVSLGRFTNDSKGKISIILPPRLSTSVVSLSRYLNLGFGPRGTEVWEVRYCEGESFVIVTYVVHWVWF